MHMLQHQREVGNVYPSLYYDDAHAALAWLERAFGMRCRLLVPRPDGGVLHAELECEDGGVVMVASARAEGGLVGPRRASGTTSSTCVRVCDPDAHFARARAAGARISRELADEEYGSRGYSAADPEGHTWYFGTYRPGAHWTP